MGLALKSLMILLERMALPFTKINASIQFIISCSTYFVHLPLQKINPFKLLILKNLNLRLYDLSEQCYTILRKTGVI
jgi:hypothetical protein